VGGSLWEKRVERRRKCAAQVSPSIVNFIHQQEKTVKPLLVCLNTVHNRNYQHKLVTCTPEKLPTGNMYIFLNSRKLEEYGTHL
jgi:hypothetical protein